MKLFFEAMAHAIRTRDTDALMVLTAALVATLAAVFVVIDKLT